MLFTFCNSKSNLHTMSGRAKLHQPRCHHGVREKRAWLFKDNLLDGISGAGPAERRLAGAFQHLQLAGKNHSTHSRPFPLLVSKLKHLGAPRMRPTRDVVQDMGKPVVPFVVEIWVAPSRPPQTKNRYMRHNRYSLSQNVWCPFGFF